MNVIINDENRKKLDFLRECITAYGLTGLALLASNVIKIRKLYKSPNFELANSGQVRVETVVSRLIVILSNNILIRLKY